MGIKQPASEIIGNSYGRLTVVSEVDSVKNKQGRNLRHFLCRCSCGVMVTVWIHNLKKGNTESCGCKRVDTFNSKKDSPETTRIKTIRNAMMGRCYNENNAGYLNYGGCGISVCEEWHDPDKFCEWWRDTAKGLPKNCNSIERKDPSKDYCPNNCTLIPRDHQPYNKKKLSLNTSGITGVSETSDGRWLAFWSYEGKKFSKSFTITKYGYNRAKGLALSARKDAIDSMIALGVPYTEYHGK